MLITNVPAIVLVGVGAGAAYGAHALGLSLPMAIAAGAGVAAILDLGVRMAAGALLSPDAGGMIHNAPIWILGALVALGAVVVRYDEKDQPAKATKPDRPARERVVLQLSSLRVDAEGEVGVGPPTAASALFGDGWFRLEVYRP